MPPGMLNNLDWILGIVSEKLVSIWMVFPSIKEDFFSLAGS